MHSPQRTSRVANDVNCRPFGSSTWDTPAKRQSLELTTTYSTEESSNSSSSSRSYSENGCKSPLTAIFPAIHQTSSQLIQSSRSCSVSTGSSASRNNSSQYHVRLMAELLLHESMTPFSKPPLTSSSTNHKNRLHRSESLPPHLTTTTGKVQQLAELLKDKIPIYAPTPRDIEQRYGPPSSAATATESRKSQQIRRCASLPLPQFTVTTTDGSLPSGHVRFMADYLKDKIPLWQPVASSTQPFVSAPTSTTRTTPIASPQTEISLCRPQTKRSFHRSASLPPQVAVVVNNEDRWPSGHVRLMADYLHDKIPVRIAPPNASRTPPCVSANEKVEATLVSIGSTETHQTNQVLRQCESMIIPRAADVINENSRSQPGHNNLMTDFLQDAIPLWRFLKSCDSSEADGEETEPMTTNCSLADLIRNQIPPLIPSGQPVLGETKSGIAITPSSSLVSIPKESERTNVASRTIDIIEEKDATANEPRSFSSDPSYPILCRLVQQLNNMVRNCSNQESSIATLSHKDAPLPIGTQSCVCCLEVSKLLATLPPLDDNAVSTRVIKTHDESLALPLTPVLLLDQSPTRLPWDTFLNVPTKVDRKPLLPCLFQLHTVVATRL